MRSVLRYLGRVLAFGAIALTIFYFGGGRENVLIYAPDQPDLADPAGWLAAREAAFDDITPGAEARIVWAGAENIPTDVVVLYIHGFSATAQEIRPVPDRVAEALGANLIFARLPGHGRTGDALAEPHASLWLRDVATMLELARGIGERVVVMGTSTGATLASFAATVPDMVERVEAMVLISPNYRVANPLGRLLELPLARYWVPVIGGAMRSFEPQNENHGIYWTIEYPTVATVTMGTVLRDTRARDYAEVAMPALFYFSDADSVISPQAVREFADGWGAPATVMPVQLPAEGADPYGHVIAGDILSPAMTDRAVEDITGWLTEVLD